MPGSLVPLALGLAPELARCLFGDRAGVNAAEIGRTVQAAVGTPDPDAARAVLARDPALTDTLRVQLAQFAAAAEQAARVAERDAVRLQLANTGEALQQTQALVRAASLAAWGAPVISILVLATFGGVMVAAMTRVLPPGSETVVNLLLGTLSAMASAVVSYWVGSSAGSAAKTQMLYRSQPLPPPAAS